MKEKFTSELKEIFTQSVDWVKLEVEYAKFTLAEKFTMLMSALVIGAVCLLLAIVVLILLAFSLAEVFKMFMDPALAYLSVSGVVVLLILIFYLCRRPLLLNPIAKFITKLLFSSHHK